MFLITQPFQKSLVVHAIINLIPVCLYLNASSLIPVNSQQMNFFWEKKYDLPIEWLKHVQQNVERSKCINKGKITQDWTDCLILCDKGPRFSRYRPPHLVSSYVKQKVLTTEFPRWCYQQNPFLAKDKKNWQNKDPVYIFQSSKTFYELVHSDL